MQRKNIDPQYVRATLLSTHIKTITSPETKQSNKDSIYQVVKGLRDSWNYPTYDADEIGFDLLQWAAICNQIKEVESLVAPAEEKKGGGAGAGESEPERAVPKKRRVGINSWTTESNFSPFRHMTALWIAARHGYTDIVSFLLKNGADLTLAPEQRTQGYLGTTTWQPFTQPIAEAKVQNHHEVVKVLEKPALANYIKQRTNDSKEHKTQLTFLGLFPIKDLGYSKQDKLKGAAALQAELSKDTCSADTLEALKTSHPALTTGELNTIYEASVSARKLP